MRRFVIVLLAALLVALVPAPADAATSSSPRAAAKAKKRAAIVCFRKTVRTRSGRKVRKKVCRPRRRAATKAPKRTTTAPLAAPAVPENVEGSDPSPVLGTPAPVVTPAAPAPACVPESTEWLSATALDVDQRFVLRLSRTCLRAGRTIVQLQNQDAQEHDLWVEGTSPAVAAREVVASAAPESIEQADMTLNAGEWRLYCSIPGHGTMSRAVTVVP